MITRTHQNTQMNMYSYTPSHSGHTNIQQFPPSTNTTRNYTQTGTRSAIYTTHLTLVIPIPPCTWMHYLPKESVQSARAFFMYAACLTTCIAHAHTYIHASGYRTPTDTDIHKNSKRTSLHAMPVLGTYIIHINGPIFIQRPHSSKVCHTYNHMQSLRSSYNFQGRLHVHSCALPTSFHTCTLIHNSHRVTLCHIAVLLSWFII